MAVRHQRRVRVASPAALGCAASALRCLAISGPSATVGGSMICGSEIIDLEVAMRAKTL